MGTCGHDTARGDTGGVTRENVTEDPFRVALMKKKMVWDTPEDEGTPVGMETGIWDLK
jgi:hypothetical protein